MDYEPLIMFIASETAKEKKIREKREEDMGHASTEDERTLRKTGGSIIVKRPKGYGAHKTIKLILNATSKQESMKEAYKKKCRDMFDSEQLQGYLSAASEPGNGFIVQLTMTEEKKYRTQNGLEGKRGKCFMVFINKT